MQPQLLAAEWSPLPPAVPAAPPAPAATASVLLELLDDDLLLRCVALLGNPRMLLRLAVCCRRFGAVRHGGRLPIAHEAARQWVGGCSARQQEWVVRPLQDLGWLGRMHEVIQLQTPAFSQANERISLSLGGRRADYYNQHWPHGAMQGDRCAKSSAIMRAGRHFAQFSLVWATECMLGVVPPGHSVNEAGTNTFTDESHCFLKISTGKRWPDGLAQWADWEVRKRFCVQFHTKTRSFGQDRLGTNRGKVEKRGFCRGCRQPSLATVSACSWTSTRAALRCIKTARALVCCEHQGCPLSTAGLLTFSLASASRLQRPQCPQDDRMNNIHAPSSSLCCIMSNCHCRLQYVLIFFKLKMSICTAGERFWENRVLIRSQTL